MVPNLHLRPLAVTINHFRSPQYDFLRLSVCMYFIVNFYLNSNTMVWNDTRTFSIPLSTCCAVVKLDQVSVISHIIFCILCSRKNVEIILGISGYGLWRVSGGDVCRGGGGIQGEYIKTGHCSQSCTYLIQVVFNTGSTAVLAKTHQPVRHRRCLALMCDVESQYCRTQWPTYVSLEVHTKHQTN